MHDVNKPATLFPAWALILVYLVNLGINSVSLFAGDVLGFAYCLISLLIVFTVIKRNSTGLILLKLQTVFLLFFCLIVLMAIGVVELAGIDMKVSSDFYLETVPLSLQIVLFYTYAGLQGYVAFSKRTKEYVQVV